MVLSAEKGICTAICTARSEVDSGGCCGTAASSHGEGSAVSTQPRAAHCSQTTPPPRVLPPTQGSLPGPPPHTHPTSCTPCISASPQYTPREIGVSHILHPISLHPASQLSHPAPCIPTSHIPASPHSLIPARPPSKASSAFMRQPPSLQPGSTEKRAEGVLRIWAELN